MRSLIPTLTDGRAGRSAICAHCNGVFVVRLDRTTRYCSRDCYRADTKGKPIAPRADFIHQSDDAAKKIRANGLINKRIKIGMIERPAKCELCNITGRVDACHIDYDRPDVVTFACRSCHMRSHYDREVEARLIARAESRGGPPCSPLRLRSPAPKAVQA